MRRRRLTRRELAAGCLVVCLSAATPAPAVAGPGAVGPGAAGPGAVGPGAVGPGAAGKMTALGVSPAGPPGADHVTLITGDRLAVTAGGAVSIDPIGRRPGISYQVTRDRGHTSVVPSDASGLIRSGLLDPRLFDVTALAESGQGDAGDLGLILTGQPAARSGTARESGADAASAASATATEAATAAGGAATAARGAGATITRRYPTLGAVATRQPVASARRIWSGLTTGSGAARSLRPGLGKIWLDGWRKPALDVSVPQIGAPVAWASGYTGAGVDVAVLDTGVDATHPDLAGRVVEHANFTTGEYGEDDRDVVGHGTHVAATVGGTGAASGGKYKGVAPGARLLDGKICVTRGCADSWILAGMEWAAADKHAKVVNLSLGDGDNEGIDPIEAAVNALTARYGTLFVVAAGNDGGENTVESPGSADAALTVGAVDRQDQLARFSSRGPRLDDGAIKPDVTAPGVEIVAARGKDATGVAGNPGDPYTTISGTSMATPHVAGAAALLFQEHPDATPAEVKALLMATARPNPALTPFEQGAGRIDVGRAVAATVLADPPSLSLGRQLWPHGDDPVLTRTLTYRNSGDRPVALAMTAAATAPDGTPAPAGMLTVTPTEVTVPAGGSAEVTVTADTNVTSAEGYLRGTITATGAAAPVTTPFAVEKEPESYNVAVTHLDRDGAPTGNYSTTAVSPGNSPPRWVPNSRTGTGTVRLRKGRYTFLTFEYGADGAIESLLAEPGVVVDRPTSVTIDGRAGKPISLTGPDLVRGYAMLAISVDAGRDDATSFGYTILDWGDGARTAPYYTGQTSDRTDPDCYSTLSAQWRWSAGEPGGEGENPRLPDRLYNVAWGTAGRLYSGLTRHLTERNLAEVKHTVGNSGPVSPQGGRPQAILTTFWPVIASMPFSSGMGTRTESAMRMFYNADGGLAWNVNVEELLYDAAASRWVMTGSFSAAPRRYRPRTVTFETWNTGVYGPSLAPQYVSDLEIPALVRSGDTLEARLGAVGDGQGRWGYFGAGSTSLSRDGTVIGSSERPGVGTFQVPAGEGRYRLSVRAGKPALSDLSTSISADWTFRSANAGSGPTRVPLWSVRFPLGASNALPAGRAVDLPLVAAPQPGSRAGRLRTVTVEISFDDGATWRRAHVTIAPDGHGHATVTNPTGAGYASLRTHVEDSAGSALDQTIIHAYRITAG